MMPPAAIALGEVGEVDPPRQASKIVVNIGCRRMKQEIQELTGMIGIFLRELLGGCW